MARRRRRRKTRNREDTVSLHVSTIVSDDQGSTVRFDGPHDFTERNVFGADGIKRLLNISAENSRDLLIVVVEGQSQWLYDALSAAIQHFPHETLDYVASYQRATYGQAILPTLHENNFDFAIEHVDIEIRDPLVNTRQDDPKFEARWTPLSTWCCWRGGLPSHPKVPIIVIVGRPNVGLPDRLSALYSKDRQRRYNRLKALPHWIYTDLLFEFTKWDEVWSATRAHMNVLRDEVYGEKAALPILEQTRALHRYMETIINQRECLRTHVASVKAYTLSLCHLKRKDSDYSLFSAAEITNLEQRLDDIERYLEHHQLTSETTVKSMENLLGLAFNTETVSQGLQVKRLNYLALVFLPLSFVAGIFGITTITLQPSWYPVYAFPILIGTIMLAFLFGKAITWWENHRVARARARDNYSDEEAPFIRPRPPPTGPSRSNSSRKKGSTRPVTMVIGGKMWEDTEQDQETDRRHSQRHYNQRGKAPPVIIQPPVRLASAIERDKRNGPSINPTARRPSNIPEEIEMPSAPGPSRKNSESFSTYRARGYPPPPPPPHAEILRPSTEEMERQASTGNTRETMESVRIYQARGRPPPPPEASRPLAQPLPTLPSFHLTARTSANTYKERK